jgi:hypothetical protein
VPKCDECGQSFTQYRAAGKCPKCGAWQEVRCENCGFTAAADEFLYGGGACPKCGQHTEVPGQKRGLCFIATAACGSEWAGEVVQLRRFRDLVLDASGCGRRLVALYERLSPPLARLIARSALARRAARALVVRPAAHGAARIMKASGFVERRD